MIGSAAYYSYINGEGIADHTLAPKPNLSLQDFLFKNED